MEDAALVGMMHGAGDPGNEVGALRRVETGPSVA
jgi:hypothetical protein